MPGDLLFHRHPFRTEGSKTRFNPALLTRVMLQIPSGLS